MRTFLEFFISILLATFRYPNCSFKYIATARNLIQNYSLCILHLIYPKKSLLYSSVSFFYTVHTRGIISALPSFSYFERSDTMATTTVKNNR